MIALARKMTQIMHQMTEYTRGEGQLKTNKGKKSHFDLKTNLKKQTLSVPPLNFPTMVKNCVHWRCQLLKIVQTSACRNN